MKASNYFLSALAILGFLTNPAVGAERRTAPKTATPAAEEAQGNPTEGEAIDVSKITQKYWAQGKEAELGVVQNRKFTSSHRFELEAFAGVISSDPFLSVNSLGASLGYHFNQYFSLHAIGWKASANPSDALKVLQAPIADGGLATTANTNKPSAFYGLEGDANLLYGKLSVLGKMIIYVDIFILGGIGETNTETGTYITPFLGIGQKVHIDQHFSLQIDYRVMRYNENIAAKVPSPAQGIALGQNIGNRANTSDAVTLGISYMY